MPSYTCPKCSGTALRIKAQVEFTLDDTGASVEGGRIPAPTFFPFSRACCADPKCTFEGYLKDFEIGGDGGRD
jgi:hypothetical protein